MTHEPSRSKQCQYLDGPSGFQLASAKPEVKREMRATTQPEFEERRASAMENKTPTEPVSPLFTGPILQAEPALRPSGAECSCHL